jgi:hypothetical protein
LKWEIEKEWHLCSKKKGPNHSKAIQLYCPYKLLMHWFGYTESGKDKIRAMSDLEYRAMKTKNLQKKALLYKEIDDIYGCTGSACYDKAIELVNTGNLETALAECNEGIKRSPESIHLYSLKAKILAAMSETAISEGLKVEPKDTQLLSDRLINNKLHELRSRFSIGEVDADTFIKFLEKTVSGNISDELPEKGKYQDKVKSLFPNYEQLQEESIILLITGEYLLDRTPGGLDYAPSAVEFCKAVEIELEQRLLLPFKIAYRSRICKDLPKTKVNSGFCDFCIKGKSMTLGGLAFILQVVTSKSKNEGDDLLKLFADNLMSQPEYEAILETNGLRGLLTPYNVDKYRNGAAHVSVFPKERAEATQKWCYAVLNSVYTRKTERSALDTTQN